MLNGKGWVVTHFLKDTEKQKFLCKKNSGCISPNENCDHLAFVTAGLKSG